MNDLDLAERIFGVAKDNKLSDFVNSVANASGGGDVIIERGDDNESVKQQPRSSQGWTDLRKENNGLQKASALASLITTVAEAI